MAHFRGWVKGNRKSVASRCGTRKEGLVTKAQSWDGDIRTRLFVGEDGEDWYEVVLYPSGRVLAKGSFVKENARPGG